MNIRICTFAWLAGAVCLSGTVFSQDFVQSQTPLTSAPSALTYGPDGTLYVFNGADPADATAPGVTNFTAITADGVATTIDLSAGVELNSLGGAVFNAATGRVLVTDNEGFGDTLGNLLSIDVTTGQTDILASGIANIGRVAVRSTGEVFVSDANGSGAGTVLQVLNDGTVETVVDSLDFSAGLDFDLAGNLIFQQVDGTSFLGSVSRLEITDGPAGIVFGTSAEVLATGLSAGFDVAVDTEGDLFITGTGGLFELDQDASGEFLGTATNLVSAGFSTGLAFLGGDVDFDPASIAGPGEIAPLLTFIPEFDATELTNLSVVSAVPEPTSMVLACSVAACCVLTRRRREAIV